jgi:hypothetical protein
VIDIATNFSSYRSLAVSGEVPGDHPGFERNRAMIPIA